MIPAHYWKLKPKKKGPLTSDEIKEMERHTGKSLEELVIERKKQLEESDECDCGGPRGHVPNGIWCRKETPDA